MAAAEHVGGPTIRGNGPLPAVAVEGRSGTKNAKLRRRCGPRR
ncbi:hypothetical protein ACFPM0_16045 [Pseudonocardia sulfidoxydans]